MDNKISTQAKAELVKYDLLLYDVTSTYFEG